MPKSRAQAGEHWRPSDKVAESATFRIFNTELRGILKRCAAAMDEFVELVEAQLTPHPEVPCRVALFDKPAVRLAWQRIVALRGDAQSLVVHTVASYGVSYPIPREPLTGARVKRPHPPKGCACARRSMVLAELRGWLSAHESALLDMLAPGAVAVLESRQEVDSRRLGLMSGPGPDGAMVTVAEPSIAESDRSIAARCPLLVKDGFHNFQLAVADASMRDLSAKAARLRVWKPKLVTRRTLDPDWPRLVHTHFAVTHTEFRDQPHATNRNAGAAPTNAIRSTPNPSGEDSAWRLFLALNALQGICTNARLFRELAERRERTWATRLHLLNVNARTASDHANKLARAGAPVQEQWAALTEGVDRANNVPPAEESAAGIKALQDLLNAAHSWSERAREATRAGGARWLDAATQPNVAGQSRSIELHTKLQEAERVFVGLKSGVSDPRTIIDKHAASMAELGEWFARTRDELGAVFEMRGLDAPANTPTAPDGDTDNAAKADLRADVRGKSSPRRGDAPKETRRERQLKWLAEAMLVVRDHPEWPDARIAEQVGIHKSRLSRSPQYRTAASMARTARTPEGSVTITKDDKVLEAVDGSFDPNRPASRQSQDEEDLDARIDRDMRESATQRQPQRLATRLPVNRRSDGK